MNKKTEWNISNNDLIIIRELAKKVRDFANSPLMTSRRNNWIAHNDLKPSKPIVLIETGGIGSEAEGFIKNFPEAEEFMISKCEGEFARGIEMNLRGRFYNYMTVNDDEVVEATFPVAWSAWASDFGIEIKRKYAADLQGRMLGFHVDPPIKDIKKAMDILKPRTFGCDKEASIEYKYRMQEVFDGILDVQSRSSYWWTFGMTWTVIDLIGLDNLMIYMYDEPEALHDLMNFMTNDHIAYAKFLEKEGLITLNNRNDAIGSGSRGYTNSLNSNTYNNGGSAKLKDTWVLLESQETVGISPEMFGEFIFPYHEQIADKFGLVYYGCCEPLHNRMKYLKKIENIRSCSVSPWCDEHIMAKECKGKYVYSRKPAPSILGLQNLTDDMIRENIRTTLKIAEGCNIEFVMKDLHTVCNEPMRMKRWVDIAREEIG